MIPETGSSRKIVTKRVFFFCIFLIVVACSDDEPDDEQSEQDIVSSEEEVLHVREWYPSPKYVQQRQIMQAPVQQQRPNQYVQQPRQYYSTPDLQNRGTGQTAFQQYPNQAVPRDGSVQYWQQPVQSQQFTTGMPGQYGTQSSYDQRPWGDVPVPKQHGYPGGYDNIWQPTNQAQQWEVPAQGGYPEWGDSVPYGAAPGYGPGYIW
ncbi:MAG: hypothetical protein PVJ66_06845 [Gammaproteobacteria bacterium]|jgi:hypothetical protein